MFTRVAAEAGDDDIQQVMFGDDAPHSMVAMLTEAEQDPREYPLSIERMTDIRTPNTTIAPFE